ncbi:hypothetical protein OH817_03790 [Kocuria rhizophila]|uniref:hypothetical protein n=1 Tax=Kocuria rhizophila TaxID=72000 RepID=UPI002ED4D976|nr:hypothetical protein OH817_03790 [Kocuria rhizophila]
MANSWFAKKHADLNYNLAPLVRLLKKWNNAHSKRLRSFHLETIAASTFKTLGGNRQSALASFFEWAPSHFDVTDPGGQSGTLSGYLTWAGRQEIIQAIGSAAERARKAHEAEARGDHDEAKRLWRIILGSTFPN